MLVDGDPAKQDFEHASADYFKPGATIDVALGYKADNNSVFTGTVTSQRICVNQSGANQLVVQCRHGAYRMALAKKSACHEETTDQALFESLVSNYNLDPDVVPSSVTHATVSQYQVSDWDFLVSRAQYLGLVGYYR